MLDGRVAVCIPTIGRNRQPVGLPTLKPR